MNIKALTLAFLATCALLQAGTSITFSGKNPAPPESKETFGGPLLERTKLTGDWRAVRDDLAATA